MKYIEGTKLGFDKKNHCQTKLIFSHISNNLKKTSNLHIY